MAPKRATYGPQSFEGPSRGHGLTTLVLRALPTPFFTANSARKPPYKAMTTVADGQRAYPPIWSLHHHPTGWASFGLTHTCTV